MAPMVIYGIVNCDNCRKARKAFPEAGFVDVREDGLPDTVRDAALAHFGTSLINTRSTTWRNLDEVTRAQNPLDLLAAHPTLMKRPLIKVAAEFYLGWTKAIQADLEV